MASDLVYSAAPEGTSMEKQVLAKIGHVEVWHYPSASTFFFKSGLNVDADGSPRAYGPNGSGLDDLASAGHPGHWWALVTDTGKPSGTPLIQGPRDPAPGFYISTTSLENHSLPHRDPHRYVDASVVPYFVLPGHHKHGTVLSSKLKLGDMALVFNGQNGLYSYAIFADVGPVGQIGEGSIALAQAVGTGADPKRGNCARDIVYVVFPGSGNGHSKTANEIQAIGRSSFQAWGAFTRLGQCFPEYASKLPKQ
jgi:hypothetical protein